METQLEPRGGGRFGDLVGKTLTGIKGSKGDDEMVFTASTGEKYKLFHYTDCCETVLIEDICGDLSDLLESPIVQAEESSSENDDAMRPDEYSESYTWTFYKLATVKGSVTIRWLGESNGYYSEEVDFELVSE